MVVNENVFYSYFRQTILTEFFRNFLIDNHYKSIFKSVRNACTSPRVLENIYRIICKLFVKGQKNLVNFP